MPVCGFCVEICLDVVVGEVRSVILAFVVCSIKLVTSAVGISLPLIFCI